MLRDGERVWVLVSPIDYPIGQLPVRPLWWFSDDMMRPAPPPVQPAPPEPRAVVPIRGRVDRTLVNIERVPRDDDAG